VLLKNVSNCTLSYKLIDYVMCLNLNKHNQLEIAALLLWKKVADMALLRLRWKIKFGNWKIER